jgi:hypothetical protein
VRGWLGDRVGRDAPCLDPIDQGSEDCTLARYRQLRPVLAEICGPRDKPLLH